MMARLTFCGHPVHLHSKTALIPRLDISDLALHFVARWESPRVPRAHKFRTRNFKSEKFNYCLHYGNTTLRKKNTVMIKNALSYVYASFYAS